jgi:branched-chain amino acid transport system substrate-binding protein
MRTMLAALALLLATGSAYAQPVRIGVLVDQSSVFSGADGGGSILAVQMAVEDFGGKVLGRPIEVVSADHQNKPDIGSGIVREWVTQQGVLAVAGGANSAVAFAAQDIARQADRIYLNVNGTSSDLSNTACSPNSVYWGIDTYALAKVMGTYITQQGHKSWFFVTSDYTFGHALQRDTEKAVEAAGGSTLGQALHPFNNADFASQLLQAQGSGAQVVAFANSGDDFTNAMKQAAEFGLTKKQHMAGLLVFMTNLEALGLPASQGLQFATPGEWTATAAIEEWSRRFMARDGHHLPPVPGQMGMYGAVHHYLRAMQAVGSTDARAVMAQMKAMPTDDFATAGARVRVDGRLMYPVHVVEVKQPGESRFAYDYVKDVATVAAEQAFRPLAESQCPLVRAAK